MQTIETVKQTNEAKLTQLRATAIQAESEAAQAADRFLETSDGRHQASPRALAERERAAAIAENAKRAVREHEQKIAAQRTPEWKALFKQYETALAGADQERFFAAAEEEIAELVMLESEVRAMVAKLAEKARAQNNAAHEARQLAEELGIDFAGMGHRSVDFLDLRPRVADAIARANGFPRSTQRLDPPSVAPWIEW